MSEQGAAWLSGMPAGDPSVAQVSTLVAQAQILADQIRLDAEHEVASLRAESRRLRDENYVVEQELDRRRQDVLAFATSRIEAAKADASAILEDAANQAALVAQRAERAATSMLAQTRAESEQLRTSSTAEADTALARARQIEREAQERIAAREAALAVQIEQALRAVDDSIEQRRAEAEAEVIALIQRGQEEVARMQDAWEKEETTARAAFASDRGAVDLEIADRRGAASIERERLAQQAQAMVEAEFAQAAEHVKKTKQAMADLVAKVNSEVESVRHRTYEEMAAHVAGVRTDAEQSLAGARARADAILAEANKESEAIVAKASSVLQAARTKSEQVKAEAAQESERIINRAQAEAKGQVLRASQRLAEADAGAKLIRERAAADMEQLQHETYERVRILRDEAVALLNEARADADATRAEAREMMENARGEVALLAQRRDDITAQLGHMSGVIEALAVADRPTTT